MALPYLLLDGLPNLPPIELFGALYPAMSETGVGEALVASELTLRLRQQELVAAFGLFALREDRLQATLQEACETAAAGWKHSSPRFWYSAPIAKIC